MRMYPIVPLCPAAGIIGFCDETISLASYLIGRLEDGAKAVSAHSYYRPKDAPAMECRQVIAKYARSSQEQRIEAFKQVMRQFKPVFRFYFIDNFPNPVEFMRHRRTYTVSLAVSSIVGYIVGLGDRHMHNILLDLNSSEVIHIDLGVAFEQGRTLAIPETVPFRLTRDLVDGCGPLGVEGVFRKTCEATLEILQKNRAAIMTVLEVFTYDPLHLWTLNPLKASKLQLNNSVQYGVSGSTSKTMMTNSPSMNRSSIARHALPDVSTSLATCRLGDNQMASRVLLQVCYMFFLSSPPLSYLFSSLVPCTLCRSIKS